MRAFSLWVGFVLMAAPAATHAADPPAPAPKVTQELLNSIHVAPKLILHPFPAYAEKYLPFAMAASMESTQKGRLWLFFHQSVGMFDGSCSNWFVRCDDPDAEKPVWTEPVFIGFGASLNKPIVRKNGEWILPVSLWERWHIDKPFADRYRERDAVRGANVFVSDDEGASWRFRGGIIFKDSCFNERACA